MAHPFAPGWRSQDSFDNIGFQRDPRFNSSVGFFSGPADYAQGRRYSLFNHPSVRTSDQANTKGSLHQKQLREFTRSELVSVKALRTALRDVLTQYRSGFPHHLGELGWTQWRLCLELNVKPTERQEIEFLQRAINMIVDKPASDLFHSHYFKKSGNDKIFYALRTRQGSLLEAVSLGLWGTQEANVTCSLDNAIIEFMAMFLKEDPYNIQSPRTKTSKAPPYIQRTAKFCANVVRTELMDKMQQSDSKNHEFHIFVLSQVLRRPIIVYTVCSIGSGRRDVSGIYLPCTRECDESIRSPLCLLLSDAGFSPLVPFVSESSTIRAPVLQSNGKSMRIWFQPDYDIDSFLRNLQKYMDLQRQRQISADGPCVLLRETDVPVPIFFTEVWTDTLCRLRETQSSPHHETHVTQTTDDIGAAQQGGAHRRSVGITRTSLMSNRSSLAYDQSFLGIPIEILADQFQDYLMDRWGRSYTEFQVAQPDASLVKRWVMSLNPGPAPYVDERQSISAVGLHNMGSSCYLNSVVQCLFNTRRFVDCFLGGNHIQYQKHLQQRSSPSSSVSARDEKYAKINFARSLGVLFLALEMKQWGCVTPSGLKSALDGCSPHHKYQSNLTQQDAHEVFTDILWELHSGLSKTPPSSLASTAPSPDSTMSTSSPASTTASPDSKMSTSQPPSPDGSVAASSTAAEDNTSESIVKDIFMGTLSPRLVCPKCSSIELKNPEPIWSLPVHIPATKKSSTVVSLGDCVKSFFADQKLVDYTAWRCSGAKCKKLRDSPTSKKTNVPVYKVRVEKLPLVLVIQVKRFETQFVSPTGLQGDGRIVLHKNGDPVKYTQFIDLRDYYSGSEKRNSKSCKYRLYSFIEHQGNIADGHYIAHCLDSKTNSWYRYDDSIVTVEHDDALKKAFRAGYLYFYMLDTPMNNVVSL